MIVFSEEQILNNHTLSSAEIGFIACMVNDPEYDYRTLEELCKLSPSDTPSDIQNTMNSLIAKNYVFLVDGNRYAFNKVKIIGMRELSSKNGRIIKHFTSTKNEIL